MTTLPPGFYTEATTNTMWTDNTWLTTEVRGQQTILPVLVGCKSCGSSGGGLVLWNLPELPNVEFIIPGFPGLPKFHLPCIKIFGIVIAGDCNPPKTDDDNDKSSQSDNPNTFTLSKASTSLPTSFPTAASLLSTQASSSSACSITKTASDCSIFCQATPTSGTSAVSNAQSCRTTCYSTTAGCSATGSTTMITTTSQLYCAQTCSSCMDRSWTSQISTNLSKISAVPQSTITGVSLPTGSSIKKRTMDGPTEFNGSFDMFFRHYAATKRADVFWPRSANSEGFSNSRLKELKSGPYNAMLWGLFGCTAVIVASEKAIYIAHFFEVPTFNSDPSSGIVFTDPTIFERDVKNMLTTGYDQKDDKGEPWMESLAKHTLPGGFFHADEDTHLIAIIVTPRNPLTGSPMYEWAVNELESFLRTLIPGLQTPNPGPVFLYDKSNDYQSNDPSSAIGKVLIQYNPDEWAEIVPGCGQTAAALIRVWIERNPQPIVQKAWVANVNQWSGITATGFHKRAGPTGSLCTLPSTTIEIEFPTSISATLTISTTSSTSVVITGQSSSIRASSTPGSTTMPTNGSLVCVRPKDPGAVPSGIPRNQLATNVTDFCASMDRLGQKIGCDNQKHDGFFLSTDCPLTTEGLLYDYTNEFAWINVTLVEGRSFIVNSTTCNAALSKILIDCLPLASLKSFPTQSRFGGSLVVADGAGGAANFTLTLFPHVCSYTVVADLVLQNEALCSVDYCNCSGTAAPLLTSTISGHSTINCDYTRQPTAATCPSAPATSTPLAKMTSATFAKTTSIPPTTTASSPLSIPSSGSSTKCNCNENGCSADSPSCCANGSCAAGHYQPSIMAKALPMAIHCNCDESLYTADSPLCCANGTCGT